MDKVTVLARALALLNECVIVRWLDEDGSVCGVTGTLKRVWSNTEDDPSAKTLFIQGAYAEMRVDRVIDIQAA